MRSDLSLLWTWHRTLDRLPYLLTGILLFLVKFAIDWTIATQGFGQPWSPLNYLIWPSGRSLRIFTPEDPNHWFALTLLLVAMPFIWTGVILTLHRLRAAGLPLVLAVFFFVPLVNLLLFTLLVLLPTREALPAVVVAPTAARRGQTLRQTHQQWTGGSHWRSGLLALAVTVPLTVLAVVLGANVLESYGFSLFVGAPFALGMISVLLFGLSRPQPFGLCLLVAFASAVLAGLAIIAIALEGLICLIMAAPIAFVLTFLGALVGYAIQARPWLSEQVIGVVLALVLLLPALMAAEPAGAPEPDLRAVRTEVIVNAPPEEVWPHVVAFTELPEPDDWFFQTGIAYPQRAEMHGTGVGAVRYCIFSTGPFVEPIEVWEPPVLLRFGVTSQPEPMREWSPYAIHPPHLDHYLQSHRGQFLLEALPDGRTRLEGTTWYTNRMWPAPYWGLWSDSIIHRIHRRVLVHVQRLAETPAAAPAQE